MPGVLTNEESAQLERWARRLKTSQRLVLRSQIVLACAQGDTNTEVAEGVGVSMPTAGKAKEAVFRRLLVRCWAMLRDGTPWRTPRVTCTV